MKRICSFIMLTIFSAMLLSVCDLGTPKNLNISSGVLFSRHKPAFAGDQPLLPELSSQDSEPNKSDIEELVDESVDRAFLVQSTLLNIFLAALAALATLLGIITIVAGLYFFIFKKSVENDIRKSLSGEILGKVKPEEFQAKLQELEGKIKSQTGELQKSISDFQATLDTLRGEFNKLQLMKKINEYVVDLPPEAVPFLTKMNVQRLLVDAEELLDSESLLFTAKDYISLGNTFLFSSQHTKALELYEKAAELKPDDSNVFVQKARAYYYLKKYDDALSSCEIAVRIDPFDQRAWNVKGTVFGKLSEISESEGEQSKNLDEEIKCYQKSLEIDNTFSLAWYNMACHLSLRGEIDEAFDCLEKAIRYNKKIIIAQAEVDSDLNNLRRNKEKFSRMVLSV